MSAGSKQVNSDGSERTTLCRTGVDDTDPAKKLVKVERDAESSRIALAGAESEPAVVVGELSNRGDEN